MGLMAGGGKKSMGLISAGQLARLLLVLTSLNIMEIMFGIISLTEKILTGSLEFGCVCTGLERGWCFSVLSFLPHVAALVSLRLPFATVTEGFDALRGSSSRRSSAGELDSQNCLEANGRSAHGRWSLLKTGPSHSLATCTSGATLVARLFPGGSPWA